MKYIKVLSFSLMVSVFSVLVVPAVIAQTNTPIELDELVSNFQISPDGAKVVYRVFNENIEYTFSLYSVAIDGGTTHRLADTVFPNYFRFTPDSNKIIFFGSPVGVPDFGLYSVDFDGSNLSEIGSDDFPFSSYTSADFDVSLQSDKVVYASSDGIVSASINGGGHVELLAGGIGAIAKSFSISPDGNHVAIEQFEIPSNDQNLFLSSMDGSTLIDVSAQIPNFFGFTNYKFTPDSNKLLINAGANNGGNFFNAIYAKNVAGLGTPTQLTPTPSVNEAGTFISGITISADSQSMLFSYDPNGSFAYFDIYTVPIAGGNSSQLTNFGGTNNRYCGADFLDNNQIILCTKDTVLDESFWYLSPLDGQLQTLLNPGNPIPDMSKYQITGDGEYLVIEKEGQTSSEYQLLTLSTTGGIPKLILDQPLPIYSCKNDSFTNYYSVDKNTNNVLFCDDAGDIKFTNIDGAEPQLVVNTTLGLGINFEISGNSKYLVYLKGFSNVNIIATLYSIEIPKFIVSEDSFCFPIVANSEKMALVCM